MDSNKLELIKKVVKKQLNDFNFEKEIDRNQKILDHFLKTPADECVFSGNIEHGITNLVSTTTGVTHTIGYLTARKNALQDFFRLLDKDVKELEKDIKPIETKRNPPSIDDF